MIKINWEKPKYWEERAPEILETDESVVQDHQAAERAHYPEERVHQDHDEWWPPDCSAMYVDDGTASDDDVKLEEEKRPRETYDEESPYKHA